MKSVKHIRRIDMTGAEKLSAPELNAIHFSTKHTVLTPKKLEEDSTQEDTVEGLSDGKRDVSIIYPEVNLKKAPGS